MSSTDPHLALSEQPLWPPGFAAWIKVGVVYQQTHRHLAGLLRPLELTVAQFDALANLYVGDGISQQELAARLLVTKGSVTGLVNRLEERGWAIRCDDPDDRRTNRLRLTDSGKQVAEQALEIQRLLVDRMMAVLERDEREVLRQHLTLLAGRIQEMASTLGS